MKAQIQFIHTASNDELEQLVRDGLAKLKKKYEWIIQAKVMLKHDRTRGTQDRGCNIELSIPGENIFQDSWSESFEKSIANSFRKLNRQMRKQKSKLYPHLG